MKDRVLVVGPSWVGDMVMAQTLFKSLVSTRPHVTIDVMAPAAALAVTTRMPEVDRSILFEMGHGELRLLYRRRFAKSLKDYQQAIVLPNSAKSCLVPFFAGIETRTGYLGEMRYYLLNDIRVLDKRRLPRMVDRFVALGDERTPAKINYPELKLDLKNQEECTCKGKGCNKCTITLKLSAKGKQVLSIDMKNKAIEIPFEMPLVNLTSTQKLEFLAITRLGTGK